MKPWLILGTIAVLIAVVPVDHRQSADPLHPEEERFGHQVVLEQARRLAATPYDPRRLSSESPLRQLTHDQYNDIDVDSEQGIWRRERVPFRVELLPAGFVYETPVAVNIVENGVARKVSATPEMFSFGEQVRHLSSRPLPISGFRVRARLDGSEEWAPLLVFQGASYFRAAGRGAPLGLSARGLAIRTAHPTGEAFPAFTHFWIERPAANAVGIVIHSLLDSPSTTGAYLFRIIPGPETVMDISLTLFPREPLDAVGIAPLNAMFLFNRTNRAVIDDYRDAVHDAEGLQIVTASGEQIWRPLANPSRLQVSSFTSTAPRGFGLVQRTRQAEAFQDLKAAYHRRPSTWIEPLGDWGAGSVELIEIPSDSESNNNIIALWRPAEAIAAGAPWQAAYRLRWTSTPRVAQSVGRVVATRTGATPDGDQRAFVVDFDAATPSADSLRMQATSSAGTLSRQALQFNPTTGGVRASFVFDPEGADLAELRLVLLQGEMPVSETWLYRWTAP
ncbi:glucan biosynthesis protein [Desulfatitalea alkaliphila]|uniref:Glucan biosynthesis protein n=1 Tax=Desulfatitalea alkaliphila TaxID=2929485 RepID=A0AA41R4P3_9BACT|nr:glucan biosynthesis protein [Desulfatitalea alkaliphila]MCJ8501546.1 glucan biosynthesis protein [Desulfatitalea alkaliphila]